MSCRRALWLARSVHEAAARLRDDREEIEPFDRFLLERQVWWGRLFLDPDSQYEFPARHRFGFYAAWLPSFPGSLVE